MSIEWHDLGNYTLTEDWQYTQQVQGRNFKVQYLWCDVASYRLPAFIALANLPDFAEQESIEFFKPQQIRPYLESEILQFPQSPKNWHYRLAVRQLKLPKENIINCEVKISMPSYSLDDPTPVNLLATTTKNVTTVPIAATVTKILPANSARKGVKFYAADKNKTIYLDTDNVVSATSAIESISPTKPICVPTILWTGDWYAISPGGTVSIEVEEYI